MLKVLINEDKLISDCLNGKSQAQEQLYHLYSKKMFGVCLRYAHCHEKASDILQDGFIKVFRSLKSFSGKGSFEGWIRRIITNTAIDHCRKANKMYVISEYDQSIPDENSNDILAQMGAEDIINLLQTLSVGYRTVFNMFVIEGYSHKEIAEKLEINEGTSKSQLARAKKQLKNLILNHQSESTKIRNHG